MKKCILPVVMALAAMLPLPSVAQESGGIVETVDRDKALTTIQFMNYLRYVSYEIAEYQNIFVIEDEYRNLLTDNLNLGKIPDETIENAIKDHLKILYDLRVEEKKRQRFEEKLAKMERRRRQDLLIDVLKSGSARQNEAFALAAVVGKGVVKQEWSEEDTKAVVQMSRALAEESVSVYKNYVDAQRKIEDEAENERFRLEDEKMRNLHEYNTTNFDFTLSLIRKYKIADELRLTEADVKALISCVKSDNKEGTYGRLLLMAEHQPAYKNFPMFWCHFASFAAICGHSDNAIKAARHFEEVNRYSLFRRDRLAAQTAMAKVQAMMDKGLTGEENQQELKTAIDVIVRYNYDSHDYDMAYFCAMVAHSVLHDSNYALQIVNSLIGVQQPQHSEDLIQYRDLFSKPKKEQDFATVPMMADLVRCLALRAAIEDGKGDDSLGASLKAIFGNTIATGIEKLFYIGEARKEDLFAKAMPEIDAISLDYSSGGIIANRLTARVPMTWFVLGDFPVKVNLKQGTNIVETIIDDFGKRKIVFNRPESEKAFVKIVFQRKWHLASDAVDNVELVLHNDSWPITMSFIRQADGDALKAISVVFMGKEFAIGGLETERMKTLTLLKQRADKGTKSDKHYSFALDYPQTEIEVGIRDIATAKRDVNGLHFALADQGDFEGTLKIEASFFNELGLKIGKAEGECRIAPTDKSLSVKVPFSEGLAKARTPAFVFVACKKKNTLWPRKKAKDDRDDAKDSATAGEQK